MCIDATMQSCSLAYCGRIVPWREAMEDAELEV